MLKNNATTYALEMLGGEDKIRSTFFAFQKHFYAVEAT
jgi:hypothetical protein